MKDLYTKYKEVVNYLFFGVLTTIVSIVSYYVLSLIFDLENNVLFVLANIISWIMAVIFAYVTNRKYVFNSNNQKFREFFKFVGSRIFTLLVEVVGMYLLVKVIKIDNMLAKVLIQFIVIVLNYVLSKLLVFRK